MSLLHVTLDRRPNQLSSGQRQRVAMCRAIVREPEVFLFDEPLSNLDAKLRMQMGLEIKRLQCDLETTSLYVTHDQVEAMTLADRLIVMNAGVAEQIGSPLDVYDAPAIVFVAGFIGSSAMNFLPGTVTDDRQGATLDGSNQVLSCPLPASASHDKVTVGIRPEHLEPIARDAATLELTVDLVEALGPDSLVHGQLAGGGQGSAVTVRVDGARRIAAGETLPLALAPERVHFFEVGKGLRLA